MGGISACAAGCLAGAVNGKLAAGSAWLAGGLFFNADGTVTGTTSVTGPSNWLAPTRTGAGVGLSYRLTRTGGTGGVNFLPTAGVWRSLAGGSGAIGANGAAGSVVGTIEFSTDGGLSVAASGQLTCNNTL